jgi:hypothetical protein
LTRAALGALAVAEIIIARLTSQDPVVQKFSQSSSHVHDRALLRKGDSRDHFLHHHSIPGKEFSSLSRPESVLLSRGLITC